MAHDVVLWSRDPEGWDPETNAPGILAVGRAIQIWAVLRAGAEPVRVLDVARAFNLSNARVAEAVDVHPFMRVEHRDGWLLVLQGAPPETDPWLVEAGLNE